MAGVCIFERQTFWLASELDKIAERFCPADPASVELHGNPMLSGKGIFRHFLKAERREALEDALSVLRDSHDGNRIFASVINKASVSPDDPVEVAFEQLASRIDRFLARLHRAHDTQRGLILFDKSTYETTILSLATDFRTTGHSWGVVRTFAEVPVFMDSKASRLIQLADLVAFAIFRHFERGDSGLYQIIENRFDREGGVVHGMHFRG